jgi:DtxR family transcriptional regulator, Mn-dependent transcriptional regulator
MRAAPQRPQRSMSVAVEDYAKAIYKLQSEAAVATVSTNDLARHLGVTAASASEMLRKLDDLGLVTYIPYRGVRLTEAGQRSALAVVRRHRLLELYLAVALGLSWDKVHDEAERLEHALSPELEAVIAAKLGNPSRDPHGDPIPTSDGRVEEPSARSLSALKPGERGILVRVSDADPEILRLLTRLGIALGQEVEVLAEREAVGTLTVRVAGVTHALAASVIAAMRVEVDGEA